MKRKLFCVVALLSAALCAASATRAQDSFQFGVIGHSFAGSPDDSVLRKALDESDADNLAFVVVNGIKSASEPCSDALYSARRDLLKEAENGVIVSLAASDWVGCRNRNGSIAIERLNRMRDLFFPDEFSFGASKVPLFRQSVTPKFRSYTENARWEFGGVLFATVNIPAANNHFVQDGGRNSEFEDRLIANKDWLQRLFTFAAQKKLEGIVLFADGNPLAQPSQRPFLLRGQRDGFAEMRQRIVTLANGFRGKVLLVHGENLKSESNTGIVWRRNLGSIGVASGWSKFSVDSGNAALFTLVHSTGKTAMQAPPTAQ
ncbi:hypothetical protein [Herbaspirillum sp. RV1423]|uniref:hypothetical protein n=1 Tax=Herbaspirillum sp. RV1423 TaxID=1443993 RepID=UPI0004AEB33B|nr:hypothetical protein [Herbaspirillum sp. RV1423]